MGSDIIAKVRISSSGQKIVTVPRCTEVLAGDYVRILIIPKYDMEEE